MSLERAQADKNYHQTPFVVWSPCTGMLNDMTVVVTLTNDDDINNTDNDNDNIGDDRIQD